jgi:hypothetical protein
MISLNALREPGLLERVQDAQKAVKKFLELASVFPCNAEFDQKSRVLK